MASNSGSGESPAATPLTPCIHLAGTHCAAHASRARNGFSSAWRVNGRQDAIGRVPAIARRVHIVDAAGSLVWSSTNGKDLAARHNSLAQLWPCSVVRHIKAALCTTGPFVSKRFLIDGGLASGKQVWDILVAPVNGDPVDVGRYTVTARKVSGEHIVDPAARDDGRHDRLTGLLNRSRFLLEIDQLAGLAKPTSFAVLRVDIDGFSNHNDALGEQTGDALLKAFADKLLGSVRRHDVVARIGGDEFGIVLKDTPHGQAVEAAARQLMARLAQPLEIGELTISCTASGGVAAFPSQGENADVLCRNAAAALTLAKQARRGTLVCAKPESIEAADNHIRMLALAKAALRANRVFPHYQPKVDLQTGRIVGFEALLRWRSESGSIGQPAEIWAAFSDPVLSCQLTEIIVAHVISDLVSWQRQGVVTNVAINVGDADLRQEGFANWFLARLAAAGLAPSQIEIEVTESVFIGRDPGVLLESLEAFSGAGIRIALDDFGTGHASLTHLKNFPVDIIKIDRSFITNMRTDPGDRAIVKTILGLAAGLSIEVVAEGIERSEDAAFLRSRGCDLGQGFLFGHAVEGQAVPSLTAQPVAWSSKPGAGARKILA